MPLAPERCGLHAQSERHVQRNQNLCVSTCSVICELIFSHVPRSHINRRLWSQQDPRERRIFTAFSQSEQQVEARHNFQLHAHSVWYTAAQASRVFEQLILYIKY